MCFTACRRGGGMTPRWPLARAPGSWNWRGAAADMARCEIGAIAHGRASWLLETATEGGIRFDAGRHLLVTARQRACVPYLRAGRMVGGGMGR